MTEFPVGIGVILLMAVLCHVQALVSRPELFFAVTVAREFRRSPAARRILLGYGSVGWLGTVLALALLFGGLVRVEIAFLLAIFGWLLAFAVARHWTKSHRSQPTTVREVSLSAEDHKSFRGALLLAFGPALILGAKAMWIYRHWPDIPNRIPVHWGVNGPDRWVDRTPLAVYGFVGTIALIALLMAFSGYATLYASRRVSATGDAAASEQRYRMASFLGLLVLAYVLATVLPPIEGVLPAVPFAPVLVAMASIGLVAILMYYGQGGTRVSEAGSSDDRPVGDRTADDCWKWGMFYYNPADPAFLVEKRFGIGWTWNFGNRWSWVVVPAVLATIFVPMLIR